MSSARYKFPRRYRLSLSSFAGIVSTASHWWCRLHWLDDEGEWQEADAERGRGAEKTGRFDTKAQARAAGLRLARRLADGSPYIVTEGSDAVVDPQETLSAPGNLKQRLNDLWREFEAMRGWSAPRAEWPELQKICDSWSRLVGDRS